MLEASWLIELVVCVCKSQPQEETPRSRILRMVTCEQSLKTEDVEGMLDYTGGCFKCVTLSPVHRCDVNAEFRNPWLSLAWPKTAAADVLPACEEKHGPILNTVRFLGRQLPLEPVANFRFCETLRRYESRDGGVAPKPECERKVGRIPLTEAEARRL